MARTYKFAILQATPDAKRGERVNVGIVIFRDGTLDLRFTEMQKLKALTGRDWDGYASTYRALAAEVEKVHPIDEDKLRAITAVEPMMQPAGFGWLDAGTDDEYETRVSEIIKSYISKTTNERALREPRINTEIAAEFRRVKILAKNPEDFYHHKVVRNFDFRKHKGLKADFVLKNGAYHITATLDLRKASVRIDEACMKAIVLDKSGDEFEGEKKRFGVYAVPPSDEKIFADHIDILRDYSDAVYNWMNPVARQAYQKRIYDVLAKPWPDV